MKKDEWYESWNIPKKKTTDDDIGVRKKMFTEAKRVVILSSGRTMFMSLTIKSTDKEKEEPLVLS